MSDLQMNDPQSWLQTVWDALDIYNATRPETTCQEKWDDICTAMAWIKEFIEENTGRKLED